MRVVHFLASLVLRILALPFVLALYAVGAFSTASSGWLIAAIAILEKVKYPEE